jgi:transposase InsO family protein
MRVDQLIAEHRMRLIAVVKAADTVREGCRQAGIHHSTYYAWINKLSADGPGGLLPRHSRTRIKSAARIRLESEVVAFALAHPGMGPVQLYDGLLAREVPVGSSSQVWRILRSHGLNRAAYRHQLMGLAQGLLTADQALAQLRDHTPPRSKPWIGELHAETPGDLVQFDCFHIGRLKETRRTQHKIPAMVWQYTAIDVASSFTWAELHSTAHNPSAIHTSALALRVAADLAAWGWQLNTISTDRGNEFVDHRFRNTLADLGIEHRFIAPGRPQSNGKVEQVHNTILQECWKPAFVAYHQPSITGLRDDLTDYLDYYNHHRRHYGKWNQGQTPAAIIIPNTGNQP